jgi:hypothetical protein
MDIVKPCKSLVVADEVLEKILNCSITSIDGCELSYHSFYSGGLSPGGLCGYVIYGEHKHHSIKITFYGASKPLSTPVYIFIQTNKKSVVRDKLLSIDDAVKFIIEYLEKFIKK